MGPGAGRSALILGAILALPFCFGGIFADDYFQQLAIERLTTLITPWDFFTFAPGDPARLGPLIEQGP